MTIRLDFEKVILYIELFLIVYLSGSVPSAINSNSSYQVGIVLMMILGIYCLIRGKWILEELSALVFVSALLLVYGILNILLFNTTPVAYINRMIWFVLFMAFCQYSMKIESDVGHILYRVVLFIICVSLLFFLIINILPDLFPYEMVYAHQGNSSGLRYRNYFNLYYINPTTNITLLGITFHRLSSIFWEAGVYGIYLNYALYRHLFYEKDGKVSLVIILMSIILCSSTTAWITAAFLIGMKIVRSPKLAALSRFLVLIPIAITVISFSINIVLAKKYSGTVSAVSYGLRMQDFVDGFTIFLRHPLMGTGIFNIAEFKQLQNLSRGNSNGFMTWLFTTGLVGSAIVIWPFISNLKKQSRGEETYKYLIFITYFVVSNMTEPLYTTPIILFFMAREYYYAFITDFYIESR